MAFIRPGGGGGTFTGGTVPNATTFESDVTFETNPLLNSVIGTNGTSTYVSFLKAETQPSSGSYLPLYSAFSSAPGDTEAGFLSGSLFVVGDGTTANLFVNQGSATSADFNQIITDNAGTYSSNLQFTGTAVRLGSIVSGGGSLDGTLVTDMTLGDSYSGAHFYMEEGFIQIGDVNFEQGGQYIAIDDSGVVSILAGGSEVVYAQPGRVRIGDPTGAGDNFYIDVNDGGNVIDFYGEGTNMLQVNGKGVQFQEAVGGTWDNTPQSISAGTQIGMARSGEFVQGNGGPVTITATPSLTAGFFDGQEVTIMGVDNTNTVTIQDGSVLSGSGVVLTGGANITLGLFDTVTLKWVADADTWVEISRSLK